MKKSILLLLTVTAMLFLMVPMRSFAADDDIVYVTRYGERYHTATCPTIQGHRVSPITKAQARARYLNACHVCTPDSVSTPQVVAPAPQPVVVNPAEQAVQQAYAIYIQNGYSPDAALARVQALVPQISAAPGSVAQIVQNDIAAAAAVAAPAAIPAAPAAPAQVPQSGLSAEQLVQQMFAQLIAQGFTPEQAMAAINANLPAILAQAQ